MLDRLRALFADSAESMLSKAVAERAHTVTIVLAPLVAWSVWRAISWRGVAPSSIRETRVVRCVGSQHAQNEAPGEQVFVSHGMAVT